MFTGIAEEVARVNTLTKRGNLFKLEVVSGLVAKRASLADSIAVNGTCLTLVAKKKDQLCFDVAASTAKDTNIKFFRNKEYVNLETALETGKKVGGHFVLGHIDSLLKIKRITNKNGYWEFELYFSATKDKYLVEKGSIALDGISLTVKKILPRSFTLDILPLTYEQTNLKYKKIGNWLNVEFDYLLKKKG